MMLKVMFFLNLPSFDSLQQSAVSLLNSNHVNIITNKS